MKSNPPPSVPDPDMTVFFNGLLQMGGEHADRSDYTFHSPMNDYISWEKKLRVGDVVTIIVYPAWGGAKKYIYEVTRNISADTICELYPSPRGSTFNNGDLLPDIGDDAPDDLKLWDSKRRLG